MEDDASFDPLFDHLKERLERTAKSAQRQSPKKQTKAQSEPDPAAPSESIREVTSQALNLRNVAGAGFLYWIVSSSFPAELNVDAFVLYRNILLTEAGDPTDPIERMLIEQLALAHFSIGRLQIKACSMEAPKLAVAYTDAATRLLGEFRRCALALEDYRAKQAARKEPTFIDVAEDPEPPMRNGKTRPSTNGKKAPPADEQETNGDSTEMPEWLRKRMTPPIPNGSPLAAATGSNGKG